MADRKAVVLPFAETQEVKAGAVPVGSPDPTGDRPQVRGPGGPKEREIGCSENVT